MIEFFNIKTGERVKLKDQHQIAAYINSGDMHVNSGQGQDFGWRIGPRDIARIEELKSDPSKLEVIAQQLGKPVSEIKQVDFIKYVSYQDDVAAKVATNKDNETPAFLQEYEAELAKARAGELPEEVEEDEAEEEVVEEKAEPKKTAPKKTAEEK